jgi:hypothetical protein
MRKSNPKSKIETIGINGSLTGISGNAIQEIKLE